MREARVTKALEKLMTAPSSAPAIIALDLGAKLWWRPLDTAALGAIAQAA